MAHRGRPDGDAPRPARRYRGRWPVRGGCGPEAAAAPSDPVPIPVPCQAFHKRGQAGETCVLLEIKLGARLDDKHRQQAAAYARAKGCVTVLALFRREETDPGDEVVFEIVAPSK